MVMKRKRIAVHYLSVKSRNAGILYPRGPTPVPLCPSRRIRAALNGLDAPPLFRSRGQAKSTEVLCEVQFAGQIAVCRGFLRSLGA